MKNSLLLAAALFGSAFGSRAAIPPPEKLLPDDTLVMVTMPDFIKAREIFSKSPQVQLWRDPVMKAFTDKFMAKWKSEILTPLERELNVTLSDYTALPQGQVTFALTQNGWQGRDEPSPAWLLLIDTKSKSGQLKTNLADLKKKWVDAGKPIKTEKIRDVEFSVLLVSSNDFPKTLKNVLSGPTFPGEEAAPPPPAEEPDTKKPESKKEIYIGQAESLLIIGSAAKPIERVLVQLSNGAAPSLSELGAYAANHSIMFRDAPLFGWVNTKTLFDVLTRKPSDKREADAQANILSVRTDKLIPASGLSALKSIAFSCRDANEGSSLHIFFSAPESTREGLLKILAGEAKESTPPPFVPADAVKFQRWRLDAQKGWASLEKMFNEVWPQAIGGVNFLLDSAGAAAKEKDPDFNLKKTLLASLGDDLINYQKKPRSNSSADLNSPPSLFLLASPHPEQLVGALKYVFTLMSQQGGEPVEREFLGRKIFSVPLSPLPMADPKAGPNKMNYSASGGYVAFSSDAAMLEEFLRSSEGQGKSLREIPGLPEATQKVVGAGTSWFGYENKLETMRATFEAFKNDSSSATNLANLAPTPGGFGLPKDEKKFKEWVDVSLLPGFDKVAKYFNFSVYGVTASVDGLSVKIFSPAPPQLKK